MKKTWTPEEVVSRISTDQRQLERAVLALYRCQTSHEQVAERTEVLNGIGFSASDASYLTYVAKYIEERTNFAKLGTILSGYHIQKTRNRMRKYGRQLAEMANN